MIRSIRKRSRPYDGLRQEIQVEDRVAVEAPLLIRVAGEDVAITMRTPGEDHALAIGFLFAEGVAESIDDFGTVAHCGDPADEGYGDTIEVSPGPGAVLKVSRATRGTLTTAACGVCGRRSIDDLIARCAPFETRTTPGDEILLSAPDTLRDAQENFRRTGAVHAAALLSAKGEVIAFAEDVGRHNAVDKVVGESLQEAKLDQAALLVVSGRTSFEIVQKAIVARVPAVASISGVTSLAIDLATEAKLALFGFVRDDAMNVYC